MLGLGVAYFGWVGPYRASPRPYPTSVNVWPEPVPSFGPANAEAVPGGCLILSVKVPQHAAEVFVDGVKTAQTGTIRASRIAARRSGQGHPLLTDRPLDRERSDDRADEGGDRQARRGGASGFQHARRGARGQVMAIIDVRQGRNAVSVCLIPSRM